MFNFKLSAFTRGLWTKEIPGTFAKIVQKDKNDHYKETDKWENNVMRTGNRTSDSGDKTYFVWNSQQL